MVEQPRKYRLVVNLRIAKALGLATPPSVPVRSDEIITGAKGTAPDVDDRLQSRGRDGEDRETQRVSTAPAARTSWQTTKEDLSAASRRPPSSTTVMSMKAGGSDRFQDRSVRMLIE